jgi:hypothetical protein
VMQFFENKFLKLVGGFTLLGLDAGLGEQRFGVNTGLVK